MKRKYGFFTVMLCFVMLISGVTAEEEGTRISAGPLFLYESKPGSFAFHILRPFLYAQETKFNDTGTEAEKWKKDYLSGLLCYRRTAEWYSPVFSARQKYGDLSPAFLRQRIPMTDKAQIQQWEEEFNSSVGAESDIPIPKSAAEAERLLNEMTEMKNWKKSTEKTFELFPLFHYTDGTVQQRFNLLGGLLFNHKKESDRKHISQLTPQVCCHSVMENTSILTPLVYCHTVRRSHPEETNPQKIFEKESRSFFLTGTFRELYYEPKDDAGDLELLEGCLIQRLRMTDPAQIRAWEKEFFIREILSDPAKPVRLPKTAKEAAEQLARVRDKANYQELRRNSLIFFPFFFRFTGTRVDTTLIPLLYTNRKYNGKNCREEEFSILWKLGYCRKKIQNHDNSYASDEKSILLTTSGTTEEKLVDAHTEREKKFLAELIYLEENGGSAEEKEKLIREWESYIRKQYPVKYKFMTFPADANTARRYLLRNLKQPVLKKTDYFKLLGGLLANHTKNDREESTGILLGLLMMHKDEEKSAFSILWRLLNIENRKDGTTGGHILFIPF